MNNDQRLAIARLLHKNKCDFPQNQTGSRIFLLYYFAGNVNHAARTVMQSVFLAHYKTL